MKSTQFYPPKLNPLLVRLCQIISPWISHWQYRMDLEIEPSCLEKLLALQEHRLLLLPNHPTFHDPIAMFLLSGRVKQNFHYLAAYEVFKGLTGKFIQQIGAYSIRRGLGDRSSVAKTLELLMQPACRLVIFPEGGCSFENDTVMPFRGGAIQLPFQAMNRMVKAGEPIPDLFAVPLSIKYRYSVDMNQVINDTLCRLEQTLQVVVPDSWDFYQRLRAVGEGVLVRVEKEYSLEDNATTQIDWNQRISKLKQHILQSCEQTLEINSTPNTPTRERVYKIQYVLESKTEELTNNNFWTAESIYQATIRLLNFDAISDGYVAANPTPERFLDTLTRLEREVFSIDQPIPKGHRQVFIRVGEPVNLKEHFKSYKKNRVATVDTLTQQLQETVQNNLNLQIKTC